MQRQKVQSNLIFSVGYDPATKTLEVEFLRKLKDNSRSIYRYHDVPPGKWEAMQAATSRGSYFLVHIKPNFKSTRVEEPRAEEEKTASEGGAPSGGEAA
jgi:hypothetical protein